MAKLLTNRQIKSLIKQTIKSYQFQIDRHETPEAVATLLIEQSSLVQLLKDIEALENK